MKFLLLLLIKIHLVFFLSHMVSMGVNLDHICLLSIRQFKSISIISISACMRVQDLAAVLELRYPTCYVSGCYILSVSSHI